MALGPGYSDGTARFLRGRLSWLLICTKRPLHSVAQVSSQLIGRDRSEAEGKKAGFVETPDTARTDSQNQERILTMSRMSVPQSYTIAVLLGVDTLWGQTSHNQDLVARAAL